MPATAMEKLPHFLETLGLTEEPMGSHFTDSPPETDFSPQAMELPTREKEQKNEIDWPEN